MVQNHRLTPNLQKTQRILDFFIELTLVTVLVFTPFIFGSVGVFPLTAVKLSACLVLFLWLAKSLVLGRMEFVNMRVNLPVLIFLVFAVCQLIFIGLLIPGVQRGAIYTDRMRAELMKAVSYFILFYAVLNNFTSRKQVGRLIFILFFTGVSISLLGLMQKVSGTEKIYWIYPVDQETAKHFFASFPNRNHFANYVNMIIFLAMGIVFSSIPYLTRGVRGLAISFQKWIWLYAIGLITMVSAVLFSVSRGGIFSLSVSTILFLMLIGEKRVTKRGLAILLLATVFIAMMLAWINAPQEIVDRFSNIKKTQGTLAYRVMGSRLNMADSAFALIKNYPLCGVGFGAFEFIYNKQYNPKLISADARTYYHIDHLHNDVLELLCEVGIAGMAICAIAFLFYCIYLFRVFLKRREPFAALVGAGAIASLFSMFVHSFLDFNFHITSNAVLFFVITALAPVIVNSRVKEGVETNTLPKINIPLVSSGFLRFLIILFLAILFFNCARFIARPYIAYRISEDKNANIGQLRKAIALDPLNDRYHFLLAKRYLDQARFRRPIRPDFVASAIREVKKASALNPWSNNYPTYLSWIDENFRSRNNAAAQEGRK